MVLASLEVFFPTPLFPALTVLASVLLAAPLLVGGLLGDWIAEGVLTSANLYHPNFTHSLGSLFSIAARSGWTPLSRPGG